MLIDEVQNLSDGRLLAMSAESPPPNADTVDAPRPSPLIYDDEMTKSATSSLDASFGDSLPRQ
jgi:hypothetical protein